MSLHAKIDNSDTPPRVQITFSSMRVQKEATPPRVVVPTVTHGMVPDSHRRLQPTTCRAVTPSTPRPMVSRSAAQKKLSNDKLTEMAQQGNQVFSFPTGPAITTAKSDTKNEPVIIMPEMTNAVICHDTGKSLKHQE
jgi:hypothetical protein